MTFHPVLAHAGEGATWQALLTLLALGLIVVLVLVVAGRITLETPGDLILPLAAVAVLASLSGAASETLSDWVWWAFPVGVVVLLGLLVAALTPLRLRDVSLLGPVVVIAAVGVVLFDTPITIAWHPQTPGREFQTYPVEDLAISLTSPTEGDTLPAGDVTVEVALEGATAINGPLEDEIALEALLAEPEEDGFVQVFLDGVAIRDPDGGLLQPDQDCSDGCTDLTFTIPDVEPGVHRVIIEFKASDRIAFRPSQFRQAQFTAE